MPLVQPGLDLLGALPSPLFQPGLQLGQRAPVNLCRLTATMIALQKSAHATRLECVDPVKELAPTHADLLGNLGGGELAAGGQPHRQQSLVGADVFATSQGNRHRCRKIGPLQMKSLGHVLICHAFRIVQSQTRIGITTATCTRATNRNTVRG